MKRRMNVGVPAATTCRGGIGVESLRCCLKSFLDDGLHAFSLQDAHETGERVDHYGKGIHRRSMVEEVF